MIHITAHAIMRFQERVANLPDDEVRAFLLRPSILIAANLGTCDVILPSGHRVVVSDNTVITICPKRTRRRRKSPRINTRANWREDLP